MTGHDEDGDGRADTYDVCPHLADDGTDSDGDFVGDACDPQPALGLQRWILFEPMLDAASSEFQVGSPWVQNADSISGPNSSNQVQLIRDSMLLAAQVIVGLDIINVDPTHQLAIVIRDSGGVPYNYVELFNGGAGPRLQVMEFDGTNYNLVKGVPLGAGTTTPLGRGSLRLGAQVFGMQSMVLAADIAGVSGFVMEQTPSYAGGRFLLLGFTDAAVEIHYVAIIGSNPP